MKKYSLLLAIIVTSFYMGYSFRGGGKQSGRSKKVTGIGGVFFKCRNRDSMMQWYHKHLGLNMNEYGCSFAWRHYDDSTKRGYTLWAPFSNKSKYFTGPVMINYRVEDLHWLLDELKKEGIDAVDKIDTASYGYFVHIMDPENNKIELWQAIDQEHTNTTDGVNW